MPNYECPSCGRSCDPTLRSCPSCGTPVDVRAAVTRGGWTELPPIRDMARLQFGQSTVQVAGAYVPAADVHLAAGDSVYFSHHVLLWRAPDLDLHALPMARAWKRLLAGLPIILTEAKGPGRLAVSVDNPGETIAVPLDPGQAIDVREHMFMLATGNVEYDWQDSAVWYRTEKSRVYPAGQYLDRFTAAGHAGLLMLHAAGNVFVRRLANEEILVKPTAFLYKEPSVSMQLYIEHPRNYNRVWSRRYIWLRLSGTGRVAIHSAFRMWEDPPEPVASSSAGTRIHDW